MSTIYTVEGNTSGGSTLVANGGGVFKKSYHSSYARISCIFRPKYKEGEALKVAKEALRAGIISYADSCMMGQRHTQSQFEEFFRKVGDYNSYCKKRSKMRDIHTI